MSGSNARNDGRMMPRALRCAWTAKLDDYLDFSKISAAGTRWVVRVSRVGIAARACVGQVGCYQLIEACYRRILSRAH